jgi:hypothetical protein
MPVKPIAEASREERLERALLAIEAIAIHLMDKDGLVMTRAFDRIYQLAHVARGRCCCPLHRQDRSWAELLTKVEAEGKRHKDYDVEEELQRPLMEAKP